MDPQSNSTSLVPPPQFDTTHSLLNSSTFLLHLIEPARIYTLPSLPPTGGAEDNNSSEKLKRRLIDALAFICATEREGDNGAAVCIEQAIAPEVEGAGAGGEGLAYEHGEYTSTLRIAKNGWVGEEVLQGMRDIIKSLEAFADGCKLSLFTLSSDVSDSLPNCNHCNRRKISWGSSIVPMDNTQPLLRKFMINEIVRNFKLQAQAPL